MKNKKLKKLILLTLFVFSSTALVILTGAFFDENKKYIESVKELKEVKKQVEKENFRININGAVGYIYIPDTNISYPVMQSDNSNPDFYLNHNIEGEYNPYGTPYLAAYCNINSSDNLIIYGHNISGGHIFGALMKYKNKDYYKRNKYIYLIAENKERVYEIISVIRVNKNEFLYWKFVMAENKKDYDSFVSEVKQNSIYECENTAEYGQQLITLSTCDDSGGDNRFAIVARRCK